MKTIEHFEDDDDDDDDDVNTAMIVMIVISVLFFFIGLYLIFRLSKKKWDDIFVWGVSSSAISIGVAIYIALKETDNI